MAKISTHLLLAFSSLQFLTIHGDVELYLFQNYKGPMQEVKNSLLFGKTSSDPRKSICISLNTSAPVEPKSIKLVDIDCVMIYETSNCAGQNFRVTSSGRDAIGNQIDNLKLRGIEKALVGSMKQCDRWDGGPIVDVNFYDSSNRPPIKRFEDVCNCVSMPEEITPLIRSINNTGHCLLMYERMQCSGKPLEVPSGNFFVYPNYLGHLILWKLPKMRSFMPCDTPVHCKWKDAKLRATIHGYKVHPFVTADKFGIVDLAKNVFRNNGTASFSRNYELKNSVKETYIVRRNAVFSRMSTVSTEVGSQNDFSAKVEAEIGGEFMKSFSAKVTAGFEASLSSSLVQAHSVAKGTTEEMGTEFSKETVKEFTISDKIDIPPCTEYEVSSFVKALQNVPVNYTIYFSISGDLNGTVVPANLLTDLIGPSVTYVKTKDEYTVEVSATGTMTASIGLESAVDITGAKIGNCNSDDTSFIKNLPNVYLLVGGLLFLLTVATTLAVCSCQRRKYDGLVLKREVRTSSDLPLRGF